MGASRRVVAVVVAISLGAAGSAVADTSKKRNSREARTELIADAEMREAIGAIAVLADAMLRAGSRREDVPRLLKDAIHKGKAEPDDIAAIVDWVLHEKEEAVAAGFAEALASVDFAGAVTGRDAARWSATARAVSDLFQRVLRDAQTRTSRDEADLWPEVEKILKIAAPAVAEALRERDCPAKPPPAPPSPPSDPPPPPR